MTRCLWPPLEPAQADYEALRAAVIAGTPLASPAATRFARGGLAALVAGPVGGPVFVATVRGAPRPAWAPHADARLDALAAGYALLVADPGDEGGNADLEAAR
jgi:hypothetical protein